MGWCFSSFIVHCSLFILHLTGQSVLREIFLKTDNYLEGKYLAELTKEVPVPRSIVVPDIMSFYRVLML